MSAEKQVLKVSKRADKLGVHGAGIKQNYLNFFTHISATMEISKPMAAEANC
jgi:hypothetical protein